MGTWAADMATALTGLFPLWEEFMYASLAIGLAIATVPRMIKRFR
jgi:hypothetical protein